jgi:hypothetical protein
VSEFEEVGKLLDIARNTEDVDAATDIDNLKQKSVISQDFETPAKTHNAMDVDVSAASWSSSSSDLKAEVGC